jgi:hypothetical protein
MGKGANKKLMNNAGNAQIRSQKLSDQSDNLYGQVDPLLVKEATNPQGYAPQDLANMRTASEQSLGGSTSAVTGTANLTAARTRNAGGFQGAISSGSRQAMRDLSQNAVEIEAQNARLKEQQKQTAVSQLMQLYGIDLQTALGYLNSSNEALHMENQSHPNQQGLLTAGTFIQDLGSAAASGRKAAGG